MKPRASGPSTRSGSFVFTQSASPRTVWPQRLGVGQERRDVLEPDARRREVLYLTDARTQVDRRVVSLGRYLSQVAPEERSRELCGQLSQLLQVAQGLRAAFGAPGAQLGRDELPEQRRLAACRRAEHAQVARSDAVAGKLGARRGHVDVGLRVALAAAGALRREQPEVLELLRELRRDPRPVAELVDA